MSKEYLDKDGNPTTKYIERGKKCSSTKLSEEWKETVGKKAKDKRKETMSSTEWKETIGKEQARKQSQVMKEDGKRRGKLSSTTKLYTKSRWYKVYNYKNELVYSMIPAKKLNLISKGLATSTKEKPMGYNLSSKVSLNCLKKMHLMGMYVEEFTPKVYEIDEWIRKTK